MLPKKRLQITAWCYEAQRPKARMNPEWANSSIGSKKSKEPILDTPFPFTASDFSSISRDVGCFLVSCKMNQLFSRTDIGRKVFFLLITRTSHFSIPTVRVSRGKLTPSRVTRALSLISAAGAETDAKNAKRPQLCRGIAARIEYRGKFEWKRRSDWKQDIKYDDACHLKPRWKSAFKRHLLF